MNQYTKVQNYSLRDILNLLGENIEHGTEFHVYYNDEPIHENPFPFPFRNSNSGIMLMLSGKMRATIDLETYIVSPQDALLFSSQSIIHIIEILEPVLSIGVVFTDEFAMKNMQNYEDVRLFRFTEIDQLAVLSLCNEQYNVVCDLMTKMRKINLAETEMNFYKKTKLYHYFNLLTLEIMEIHQLAKTQAGIKTNRKKEVVHAFLELLSIYVRRNRNVEFYADKLFITSGHLSKLLKEATGNTARDIIEEAVAIEARNLLMETALSLAEIAERLNFSDQSFFGKFFKKKMKITPKSFRDKYK